MTIAEKTATIKWIATLSNEQLEQEYYKAVFDSLGSVAEEMYELGYDILDVFERDKYEKDLIIKSRLLERACFERGIELWQTD